MNEIFLPKKRLLKQVLKLLEEITTQFGGNFHKNRSRRCDGVVISYLSTQYGLESRLVLEKVLKSVRHQINKKRQILESEELNLLKCFLRLYEGRWVNETLLFFCALQKVLNKSRSESSLQILAKIFGQRVVKFLKLRSQIGNGLVGGIVYQMLFELCDSFSEIPHEFVRNNQSTENRVNNREFAAQILKLDGEKVILRERIKTLEAKIKCIKEEIGDSTVQAKRFAAKDERENLVEALKRKTQQNLLLLDTNDNLVKTKAELAKILRLVKKNWESFVNEQTLMNRGNYDVLHNHAKSQHDQHLFQIFSTWICRSANEAQISDLPDDRLEQMNRVLETQEHTNKQYYLAKFEKLQASKARVIQRFYRLSAGKLRIREIKRQLLIELRAYVKLESFRKRELSYGMAKQMFARKTSSTIQWMFGIWRSNVRFRKLQRAADVLFRDNEQRLVRVSFSRWSDNHQKCKQEQFQWKNYFRRCFHQMLTLRLKRFFRKHRNGKTFYRLLRFTVLRKKVKFLTNSYDDNLRLNGTQFLKVFFRKWKITNKRIHIYQDLKCTNIGISRLLFFWLQNVCADAFNLWRGYYLKQTTIYQNILKVLINRKHTWLISSFGIWKEHTKVINFRCALKKKKLNFIHQFEQAYESAHCRYLLSNLVAAFGLWKKHTAVDRQHEKRCLGYTLYMNRFEKRNTIRRWMLFAANKYHNELVETSMKIQKWFRQRMRIQQFKSNLKEYRNLRNLAATKIVKLFKSVHNLSIFKKYMLVNKALPKLQARVRRLISNMCLQELLLVKSFGEQLENIEVSFPKALNCQFNEVRIFFHESFRSYELVTQMINFIALLRYWYEGYDYYTVFAQIRSLEMNNSLGHLASEFLSYELFEWFCYAGADLKNVNVIGEACLFSTLKNITSESSLEEYSTFIDYIYEVESHLFDSNYLIFHLTTLSNGNEIYSNRLLYKAIISENTLITQHIVRLLLFNNSSSTQFIQTFHQSFSDIGEIDQSYESQLNRVSLFCYENYYELDSYLSFLSTLCLDSLFFSFVQLHDTCILQSMLHSFYELTDDLLLLVQHSWFGKNVSFYFTNMSLGSNEYVASFLQVLKQRLGSAEAQKKLRRYLVFFTIVKSIASADTENGFITDNAQLLKTIYNNHLFVFDSIQDLSNFESLESFANGDHPIALHEEIDFMNATDLDGNNVVFYLLWNSRLDGEQKLELIQDLVDNDIDVFKNNHIGVSSLYHATAAEVIQVVEYLIDAGCNVNEIDAATGNTVLHLAAHSCNLGIFKRLLLAGANYMVQNFDGDTALHLLLKHCLEPNSEPNFAIVRLFMALQILRLVVEFDYVATYPKKSTPLLLLKNFSGKTVLGEARQLLPNNISSNMLSNTELSLSPILKTEHLGVREIFRRTETFGTPLNNQQRSELLSTKLDQFTKFVRDNFCCNVWKTEFDSLGFQALVSTSEDKFSFRNAVVDEILSWYRLSSNANNLTIVSVEEQCVTQEDMYLTEDDYNTFSADDWPVIATIFASPEKRIDILSANPKIRHKIDLTNTSSLIRGETDEESTKFVDYTGPSRLRDLFEKASRLNLDGKIFYSDELSGRLLFNWRPANSSNSTVYEIENINKNTNSSDIKNSVFIIGSGDVHDKLLPPPPVLSSKLYTKRLVKRVTDSNTKVSSTGTFSLAHVLDEQNIEIAHQLKERKLVVRVQRRVRGMLERSKTKRLLHQNKCIQKAKVLQKAFRSRQKYKLEMIQNAREEATVIIQRQFREYRRLQSIRSVELLEIRRLLAINKIQKVCRGFCSRLKFRKALAIEKLGLTYLYECLVYKATGTKAPRFKRQFRTWQEYVLNRDERFRRMFLLYPTKFYRNNHSNRIQWDQPKEWLDADRAKVCDLIEIFEQGYSNAQYRLVILLQKAYRRKRAWYWLSHFYKAFSIMICSESQYLNSIVTVESTNKIGSLLKPNQQEELHMFTYFPNINTERVKLTDWKEKNVLSRNLRATSKSLIQLANYTLYIYAIKCDWTKSEQLFNTMYNSFRQRGPDNAFFFANYAIYLCSKLDSKKDFAKVMYIVQRAKKAKFINMQLVYLELGFYGLPIWDIPSLAKYRSTEKEKRAIQLLNYALFLQFFGTCKKYTSTTDYYSSNETAESVKSSTTRDFVYRISDNHLDEEDLDLSQEYYLQAIETDPKNETIILNFTFMLQYLKEEASTGEDKYLEYQISLQESQTKETTSIKD